MSWFRAKTDYYYADVVRNKNDHELCSKNKYAELRSNVKYKSNGNVNDERYLAARMREEAVNRISNQTVLKSLFNEGFLKSKILMNITDHEFRVDYIKNNKEKEYERFLFASVINEINDQSIIADIAKSKRPDKFSYESAVAIVEKLIDYEGIKDVLLNSPDDFLVGLLLANISSSSIIEDTVRHRGLACLQSGSEAIKKITDVAILTSILESEEGFTDVIRYAVENKYMIDDSAIFAAAKLWKDKGISLEAVKKLTDLNLLLEMARTDKYYYAREIAADKVLLKMSANVEISSEMKSIIEEAEKISKKEHEDWLDSISRMPSN
jgi:hypothetical protein